jgi:branched-chain amino acid transport system substrate-binding protein
MTLTGMTRLFGAAALSLVLTGAAAAQSSVKVGAVYPFSGAAASIGGYAKAAIEVALDIINNDHPELGELTLAKGVGLPHLGGAKVEAVFADNQGAPAAGQNQTIRLITEEKVVAITAPISPGSR